MTEPDAPHPRVRRDYYRSFGFAALVGIVLGLGLLTSYGLTQLNLMGMKPVVLIAGAPFFIGAAIAVAIVGAYIAGPLSGTSSRWAHGAIFCVVIVTGSLSLPDWVVSPSSSSAS